VDITVLLSSLVLLLHFQHDALISSLSYSDIHTTSSSMETQSLIAAVQVEEEALEQYKQGNGEKGAGADAAAKHVSNWSRDNADKVGSI
jgi:hypothetical protein